MSWRSWRWGRWLPKRSAGSRWRLRSGFRSRCGICLESRCRPSRTTPCAGSIGSVEILKALLRYAPRDAARVLGVTEADLGIPMLTFLFGQAQLDGRAAIISTCRLRQEFYGLAPDQALLRERIIKEMLHELGHTFGLTHCPDGKCAMSLATHIEFVDTKSASYCPRCGAYLAHRFTSGEEHADEKQMADSDRRR